MTEPSSTVVAIAVWSLLGGYLVVWFFKNFRSILAVAAGVMMGTILLLVCAVLVGVCFGILYGASGANASQATSRLEHNPLVWIVGGMLGLVFGYYTGFVTGTAAGSHEMFHACLAAVLFILLSPAFVNELPYAEGGWFWALGIVATLAVTTWGGYMAKRGKARAEVAIKRGGPKLTGGPQPV